MKYSLTYAQHLRVFILNPKDGVTNAIDTAKWIGSIRNTVIGVVRIQHRLFCVSRVHVFLYGERYEGSPYISAVIYLS